MIRDSVVHEVDVARFLLDEEITSVQVLQGVATSASPQGTSDPMVVIFETASGRIVTDEIFVRTGVAYEVRTEVVGETGSAMIGLDQNLVRTGPDGRRGGQVTPGFVERFGQAYDTELQRWVGRRVRGTIDGPGVWDGYAAVAVCEAGVKAVQTGEKVPVVLQPRPRRSRRPGRHRAGHHRARPDREPAVKLALDPQMFFATSSVYELPDVAASLGYAWIELSPKDDFIPFFRHPRIDDAGVRRLKKVAADAGVGIASIIPLNRLVRARARTSARRPCGRGSGRSRSPSTSRSTSSTPSSTGVPRTRRPRRRCSCGRWTSCCRSSSARASGSSSSRTPTTSSRTASTRSG